MKVGLYLQAHRGIHRNAQCNINYGHFKVYISTLVFVQPLHALCVLMYAQVKGQHRKQKQDGGFFHLANSTTLSLHPAFLSFGHAAVDAASSISLTD